MGRCVDSELHVKNVSFLFLFSNFITIVNGFSDLRMILILGPQGWLLDHRIVGSEIQNTYSLRSYS